MLYEQFIIKQKIKNIEDYKEALTEPFVLSAVTLNNSFFKIPYTEILYFLLF